VCSSDLTYKDEGSPAKREPSKDQPT